MSVESRNDCITWGNVTYKVMFEQRSEEDEEISHSDPQGRANPSIESITCKTSKVRVGLSSTGNAKKTCVAGAEGQGGEP